MAGLLGTSWEDPKSQGLLALAAGMLQGNIGAGVANMNTTMAGAQDAAMKRKLIDMQMQAQSLTLDRQKRDWERDDQVSALAGKFYQPGMPGMPAKAAMPGLQSGNTMMPSIDSMLPPEMQIGQPARAAVAPTAASFDSLGYANALMGVDPKQGMAALAAFKAANAPIKVGAGDTLLSPDGFTPLFTNPKEQAKPASLVEYEFAKSQGFTGTFQQFSIQQKRAGATNVTTNMGAQESEQSKTYGKGMGDIRIEIQKAGFQAPSMITSLDRLEELLQGVEGGKFAATGLELGKAAKSFGINIDPKLGNKEAAESIAIEMANNARPPGSGPMTDKDFDNYLKIVPGLAKTPEGRRQITTTLKAKANRDLAIAKMARAYAKNNGGVIDDGFLEEAADYVAKTPVFNIGSQQAPKAKFLGFE